MHQLFLRQIKSHSRRVFLETVNLSVHLLDAQRVSSTTELSQFTYLMLNASSLSLVSFESLSPDTLTRSLSHSALNILLG